MNMKIGEIIKKLRKERDVTQEKLADYLGISYQAVSKWENGTALPDITLVVPLANFFGVSADELFSLNEQITNEKIKEYEEKYNHFNHVGDMLSCIGLSREALAEYPHNFKIMANLAHGLFSYETEKNRDELISICERILEDCTEDSIRHGAIQLLCYTYPKAGQREKAVELAKKMPPIYLCSSMLLKHIYEGEEKIKIIQQNIQTHIDHICMDLGLLLAIIQKDLTLDEQILYIETSIKLYEAIYYDGNLLFYHCRLAWGYYNLAEHYMQKDRNTALKHLLTAEKHAAAYDKFDTAGQDLQYTSLFVNKCACSPSDTTKNWMGTECGMLLERINGGFTSLHDNPEFTALKERLAEKQKSI